MITYYVAEKGGELCKCEFKNITHALYGYLTLISSEEFKFRLIKKRVYDRRKENGFMRTLIYHGNIVGYYTVKY